MDLSKILEALENPNSNGILSFLLGFLFMIVVYSVTMYYQHRSKVYLYYTMYTSLIILSTLFYVSNDFFSLVLDPIRPLLFKFVAFFRWSYNAIYFLFAFSFVELRKISVKWNKIIIYPIYVFLAIGAVAQLLSIVLDDPKLMSNIFSRFFIPIISIHSIIGYYVLFKINAKFKYYIIIGSLFLLSASLIGAAMYYLKLLPVDNYMRDSILYFGIVAENILFSLGLAHKQKFILEEKNRIILEDKEKRLKSIIETQEKERGRIAQDLHDGVLQQMGGVLLQTRNLLTKMGIKENEEAKALVHNLVNSNDELRNISHQMMPKSLNELGVVAAIEDMLNLSLPYAEIQHSFEHFNIKGRFQEDIESTLYRVTQELVNNIIKHSQATEVSVQMFKSEDNVVLIVEDNGVGISLENTKNGIGIMNMNSRANAIGGAINFESNTEKGTTVTLKFPLN